MKLAFQCATGWMVAKTVEQQERKTATRNAPAKRQRKARVIADAATAKAKAAGARGRASKLVGAERRLRDSAIIACLEAGDHPKEIGATFGISERAVYGIRERFRAMPSPMDERPMEILEELARNYRRSAADLMTLARENVRVAPHVTLGAIKAAADSWRDYERLMADVGKLPENLELFRAESVLRRIGQEMMDVVARVASEELRAGDALVVLEDVMGRLDQREALELGPGAVSEE